MGYPTATDFFVQQSIPNGCTAKTLGPNQRMNLGVQALAGRQSITSLANDCDVSRKFIYQQADLAQAALEDAFFADQAEERVLFYLPVTKAWLHQVVLGLTLICHSSYRGVIEFHRDLFDVKLSLGTVHNIVQAAVGRARVHTQKVDLSDIEVAGLDEIFQVGWPVLVGADIRSTYCFLLSQEEHRDADTWAVHLLELAERGFDPQATIADFGAGIRAGVKLGLPATPCRGDVFHALMDVTALSSYLENRAYDAMAAHDKLQKKQTATRRHGRSCQSLGRKLALARQAQDKAITLADDIAVLTHWLQSDVFAVSPLAYADRCLLYDFLVEQLQARQPLCPHRIGPVCTLLKNHRDELLAFADQLDRDLQRLAVDFEIPLTLVRDMLAVNTLDPRGPWFWQKEAMLRRELGLRFAPLRQAVRFVADNTVRSSSIIENINSRLRNYFFLRRQLGNDYLALLQFFLNHRTFPRSECPERVGKSPTQLLTGKEHPHWLEMLGFKRFSRN